MRESIVLSELRVDGLPAGKVVEFIARTQANKHGKCNATIELTNIESLDDIYNWQEKEISIYARGRCLFAGILTDIVLEEKNRYSLLKAELTSMSIVVVKHFCNTCVLIIADSCPGFERSLVTII